MNERGSVRRVQRQHIDRKTGERVYYDAYLAWYPARPRRPDTRSFGVDRWGEQVAKQLATAWLRERRARG